MHARDVPPAKYHGTPECFGWTSDEVVAAVVEMVRVAAPGLVPVMFAGLVEPKLNVGKCWAPVGVEVTAAVRATLPVKPPDGVTEMVDEFAVVAPGRTVTAVPLTAKVPPLVTGETVTFTFVVAIVEPDVPVTVNTYAPGEVADVVATVKVAVAAVLPVMLTDEGTLQVAGLAAPAGLELMAQDNPTAPVNPLAGVAVMVDVFPVVAPGVTVTEVPLIVNVGVTDGLMVKVNVVEAVMVAVTESCPVSVIVYVPGAGSVPPPATQSDAFVSSVSWVVTALVPVTATDPSPLLSVVVKL